MMDGDEESPCSKINHKARQRGALHGKGREHFEILSSMRKRTSPRSIFSTGIRREPLSGMRGLSGQMF